MSKNFIQEGDSKEEFSREMNNSCEKRNNNKKATKKRSFIFFAISIIASIIFIFLLAKLLLPNANYIFCSYSAPEEQELLKVSGDFTNEQEEKIKKYLSDCKEGIEIYYGFFKDSLVDPFGCFFCLVDQDKQTKKTMILCCVDDTLENINGMSSYLKSKKKIEILNINSDKVSGASYLKEIKEEKNRKEIFSKFLTGTIVEKILALLRIPLFFFINCFVVVSVNLLKFFTYLFILLLVKKNFFHSKTSVLEDLGALFNIGCRLFSEEEVEEKTQKEFGEEKIFFKDIGGLPYAKEELLEIVTLLKEPKVLTNFGIKIPKGIILEGPPGNGKTLLAKAFANECKLPFLFRSGSEFDEIYGGLGASRVRSLFGEARKYSKRYGGCVIFIDEFDSLAGRRKIGRQEESHTLNQLLNELDGFRSIDRIIVLVCTNFKKALDPAVIRMGRFDRHIKIDNPNFEERKEIILLKKEKFKNICFDFDILDVVSMTEGCSSAQITTLLNEAVLLGIRNEQKVIKANLLVEAFEKIIFGLSGTPVVQNKDEQLNTAFHEAGHALIALSLPETYVNWISISIKNKKALGYTNILLGRKKEGNDIHNLTKKEILSLVMSQLGGRLGEEIMFGKDNVTTGACNDLERASDLIRSLILEFGMTSLGIIPYQKNFLGKTIISEDISEQAKKEIEDLRRQILNDCWSKAENIIVRQKRTLKAIVTSLLIKKSLSRKEIEYIFITKLPLGINLLN